MEEDIGVYEQLAALRERADSTEPLLEGLLTAARVQRILHHTLPLVCSAQEKTKGKKALKRAQELQGQLLDLEPRMMGELRVVVRELTELYQIVSAWAGEATAEYSALTRKTLQLSARLLQIPEERLTLCDEA